MHLLIIILGLFSNFAYASETETDAPWTNHFTSLMGQEMDCLDRKTPTDMRQELTKRCPPETSFATITAMLKELLGGRPLAISQEE